MVLFTACIDSVQKGKPLELALAGTTPEALLLSFSATALVLSGLYAGRARCWRRWVKFTIGVWWFLPVVLTSVLLASSTLLLDPRAKHPTIPTTGGIASDGAPPHQAAAARCQRPCCQRPCRQRPCGQWLARCR